MRAPALDFLCETMLGKHPAQSAGAVLSVEQTKREFGGGHIRIIGQGGIVTHRSRQALSFARPRRTQLFIVPNGTSCRSASSA